MKSPVKEYINNCTLLIGGAVTIVLFSTGHYIGAICMMTLTLGCLYIE